jgi:TolB protein
MGSDGSGPTNLTDEPGNDSEARWSNDGSRIVFASDRTGDSEVWAMDADGSNPTRLTELAGRDAEPVWRR